MRSRTVRFSVLAVAAVVLAACSGAAQGPSAVSTATGQRWQNPFGPQLAVSQAVSFVRNPQATLESAQVEDANGVGVGRVQSVTTDANGLACAVHVVLRKPSRKVVSISAGTMRFDPDDDVAQTSLTLPEISSLPAS